MNTAGKRFEEAAALLDRMREQRDMARGECADAKAALSTHPIEKPGVG